MTQVSIPNGKPGPLRPVHHDSHTRAVQGFQSQTGSQALSDFIELVDADSTDKVSIPNGKPGPLRPLKNDLAQLAKDQFQSQTGSQALSDFTVLQIPTGVDGFQSQTGSQALSDGCIRCPTSVMAKCFNPKREARPSQTDTAPCRVQTRKGFQSQTGSQALSDHRGALPHRGDQVVSIPNGKPGPLRRRQSAWSERK